MRTVLLLALVSLFACDANAPETNAPAQRSTARQTGQLDTKLGAFPAGALVEGPIVQQFAVYALPGGKTELAKLAAGLAGKFSLAQSRESHGPGQLLIESPSITDYAPPPPDFLQYMGMGLSPEDVAAYVSPASLVDRLSE